MLPTTTTFFSTADASTAETFVVRTSLSALVYTDLYGQDAQLLLTCYDEAYRLAHVTLAADHIPSESAG